MIQSIDGFGGVDMLSGRRLVGNMGQIARGRGASVPSLVLLAAWVVVFLAGAGGVIGGERVGGILLILLPLGFYSGIWGMVLLFRDSMSKVERAVLLLVNGLVLIVGGVALLLEVKGLVWGPGLW